MLPAMEKPLQYFRDFLHSFITKSLIPDPSEISVDQPLHPSPASRSLNLASLDSLSYATSLQTYWDRWNARQTWRLRSWEMVI